MFFGVIVRLNCANECERLRQTRFLLHAEYIRVVHRLAFALNSPDRDRVNLAQKLSDGQHVYIPRAGETASAEGARTRSRSSSAQSRRKTSSAPSQSAVQSADISADNPLNLNSASKEELMQLKGVGASLAQRILDYRSMRGSFHSKEELLMIAGIGEKMYAQIENIICL